MSFGLSAARLAFLILTAAASPVVAASAPLPLEAFGRLPQVGWVSLSPDGQWLAAIVNREDGSTVIARRVDSDDPPKALFVADNRSARLAWVHWVSDRRLVASVRYPSTRSAIAMESRLVAIDRDGSNELGLGEPGGFAQATDGQFQDQVVDWLQQDGHHILLQANRGRGDPSPDVVRVDVDTGLRSVVHNRVIGVRRWIADASHRVRVGLRQRGSRIEVLVCDEDGENWRTAWTYDLFGGETVLPLGFGADPDRLYLVVERGLRRSAVAVDLRDPELKQEVLIERLASGQGGRLLRDPASGQAIGISGTAGERAGAAASFWDPSAQALARAVDEALPQRLNRLLEFSADGSRYLVYSSGNGVPGEFLLGERAQRRMLLLNRQYPALPRSGLAMKSAQTVVARDGAALPAVLTLPTGDAEPKSLPAVVVAGAGPLGTTALDFDPLANFLASRGIAVLQLALREAADRGPLPPGAKRSATADLEDAAQWLVRRGSADPARICVLGEGYGGYAALMAAAQTPARYRCVVSFGGVSDLLAMGYRQNRFVSGAGVFESAQGSTFNEGKKLEELSPRTLAAQFQAPVLLAHGSEDRFVPPTQSADMAEALKRAGKSVRLVTLADGDHDLSDQALRLQFLRELDDFLGAQLSNRPAGAPPMR